MHALHLASILIVLLAAGAPSPVAADCTCRALGRSFELGTKVCLKTPHGPRLATCGMSLNNTSWHFSKEPCVAAQFNRDLPQVSANARKPHS